MGFRSRSRFLILILCICVGSFVSSAKNERPKNVQVALRGKWEGTPLLLEAGELISREGKDLFWDFIDNWLQKDQDGSSSSTAKSCIHKIVEHGRNLLSEHLASIFEVSLLLRSASPRLVLYRQLAGESLSSYPDEGILHTAGGNTESNEETERVDSLLVGVNPKSPGGKCCWVDTGGSLFFDVPELLQWLGTQDVERDSSPQPELFDFDHLYLESNASSPVAILYGSLGTDCFKEFHHTLVKAAKEGKVRHVVRPVLASGCEKSSSGCGVIGTRVPLNLGGYGVELALKNMEYKAMDDSMVKKSVNSEDAQLEDSEMQEHTPDLKSENIVADDLLASTVSDTLDIWELNDLGHQTAQKIVHSTDPLLSMQEISQNFPSIVSSLSRVKINNSVKEEILSNQRMVPPGKALMAINQALVNIEDIDLHMLIDLVRKELSLADQFSKLKIPDSSIQKLLSTTPTSDSSTFRIDFRSSHVHYLNNLEEDSMYKRWRSNVNEILMPAFPGQMRYIRKNLFHAVYIIDPASSRGLEVLEMIENFYENQLPIRFGVIFYSEAFNKHIDDGANERRTSSNDEEDGSILIVRLFHYIKEEHGVHTAFKFLSNIRELQTESGDSGEDAPERHLVEKAFVETLVPKSKSLPQDILLKLEKEKSFEDEAQKSSIFVSKLGFSKRGCTLLMNGLVFDANEEALINAMNEELPRIQEQVYYGNIASHTDVLEKFFSESGISRYNPQIVTDEKVKPKFVTLSESRSDTDFLLNDLSYLHSPETADDVKPVTHLLAVNVTSKKGINLLREGIHYLQGVSKRARLGVLFGPSNLDSDSAGLIFVKVFDIAASSHSYKKGVLNFMDQLCLLYEREFQQPSSFTGDAKKEFLEKAVELASTHNLPSEIYKSLLKEVSVVDVRSHLNKAALFLYRHLEADSNMNAVITNGRVIRITVETEFLSHDLDLLESLEFKRVKPILGIIEDVNWQDMDPDSLTSKFISDVVMLVSSSLASRERSTDSARFEVLHADYSAVILNHGNSSIHIDAVIDPLSPSGQKLASLFRLLSKYIQPSMRIILNPLSSLSDLPLKNYYRYVIPSVDDFSSTDSTVNGPKAFFANMPLSKTLTMNLDVPEPWLVEPVVAVHDLDNILLENLGETTTLEAVFELEALVLTGHCFEKDHEHPRGLQMILGTRSTPHLVDTLVMSNLGYWQMKASPGMWYLQLAPGRSSELYVLKENDGTDGTALAKRIIISDLRGKVVHLEVMKKKNKEHEKLLITSDDDNHSETEQKSDNMWNKNILKWASGLIGGKQNRGIRERSSQVAKSGRQGKTVNIFSIASGHLYERFLKIMILSVLKNTERPVKFWFIKNYLSPQFKDVIPHMAKEYGFEYELITYKWPSWLHKQTEKQRIVWAYKILFLDVIFPLSLEKVIFVDADQVVRTDMGELYDLDIKGRPYAYTPFCDNNKEMDGYRFWRQGFWKEHLRGRPYHISALYVIDLVKFRRTAAGDTLRVFYENLSKDPNSLSNLDQDLPNYAQHVVPIFSLPQEWLWCESWCGNATKPKAKTIDLCNNPMTKEPKLQGARRIVTEWVDLDSEARGFTSKFLGEDSDLQVSSPSSIPTPQPSPSKDSSLETDLESRAEL